MKDSIKFFINSLDIRPSGNSTKNQKNFGVRFPEFFLYLKTNPRRKQVQKDNSELISKWNLWNNFKENCRNKKEVFIQPNKRNKIKHVTKCQRTISSFNEVNVPFKIIYIAFHILQHIPARGYYQRVFYLLFIILKMNICIFRGRKMLKLTTTRQRMIKIISSM